MTTIETKIAKNGAVNFYANGKRTSRAKAIEIANDNDKEILYALTELHGTCATLRCTIRNEIDATNKKQYTLRFNTDKAAVDAIKKLHATFGARVEFALAGNQKEVLAAIDIIFGDGLEIYVDTNVEVAADNNVNVETNDNAEEVDAEVEAEIVEPATVEETAEVDNNDTATASTEVDTITFEVGKTYYGVDFGGEWSEAAPVTVKTLRVIKRTAKTFTAIDESGNQVSKRISLAYAGTKEVVTVPSVNDITVQSVNVYSDKEFTPAIAAAPTGNYKAWLAVVEANNNADSIEPATVEEKADYSNSCRFVVDIYSKTANGVNKRDSVEAPTAQLAGQAVIEYAAEHTDCKVLKIVIKDFVAYAGYYCHDADIAALYPTIETTNELPTGEITVNSGAEAWSLVGEYFPNGLKFTGYEEGFNREDTFYYTNDKTLYAVATCTPDNSRVECVEVINTYESGSKRKPLTVYIKPAPAADNAVTNNVVEPCATVQIATDSAPVDDFSAKLAVRQEFLDNVAGELTRKLQAACVNNDFIQTTTIHGRLYTIGDFGNVYIDPTANGDFAFVTYDNRTLARYDTPAQIEAVIAQIKATIDRKEVVFYFPTIDALNKLEPPKSDRDIADALSRELYAVTRRADYMNVTLQSGKQIPTCFGNAFVEPDWNSDNGFVFTNGHETFARYDTPEQVKAVADKLKAAIESGATEFAFPAVDELNNPTAANRLAAVACLCTAINAAAPENWEVYFDSETKTYIVSYNDRTVTTLRNLNSARDLDPKDFFYQFMNLDNDCKPVYWDDDKPPEFEPCAPLSFYADIEYDENGEVIPWF